MDARPGDLGELVAQLWRKGWSTSAEARSFSELGDALAQNRAWVLAEPHRRRLEDEWVTRGGGVQAVGPPMSPHLLDARQVPEAEWWSQGVVHLDPRASTTRLRTQAQVLGRVRLPQGDRYTIYGAGGPAPAPLWDPDGRGLQVRLLYDPKGPGPGLRPLRVEEYASIKGMPVDASG